MGNFRKIIFGILTLCFCCLLYSCTTSDSEKIIGKWQCDQDWFEFKKDQTYSAGKEFITMVNNFKYTIDTKEKELNMYTDEEQRSYYLKYEFKGMDTLLVRNTMSSNTKMISFYRVKK